MTLSVHNGRDSGGNVDTSTDDTIAVTIGVIDDDTEAPVQPDAPTVTTTDGGDTGLRVSWTPPVKQGPEITHYDVRYRVRGESEVVDVGYDGTGTVMTINGLSAGVTYEVEVRGVNDDGAGPWSEPGRGTVTGPGNCLARLPGIRTGRGQEHDWNS